MKIGRIVNLREELGVEIEIPKYPNTSCVYISGSLSNVIAAEKFIDKIVKSTIHK